MKIVVELSYTINQEPDDFLSNNDKTARIVYHWANRRWYFDSTNPIMAFTRIDLKEPGEQYGFLEAWTYDEHDISNPPNDTDDMWLEDFKTIERKNHMLEWHPSINQLRITWRQNEDTLKQQKLISPVVETLANLGLEFPGYRPS
jgi:hypothetical protein